MLEQEGEETYDGLDWTLLCIDEFEEGRWKWLVYFDERLLEDLGESDVGIREVSRGNVKLSFCSLEHRFRNHLGYDDGWAATYLQTQTQREMQMCDSAT